MPEPHIHRHTTGQEGALVNAYLVETSDGIVAVDGTLTVTDGRALRTRRETLGKPLLAVLVTHAHPDHYGGIVELVGSDNVPVVATAGGDAGIRPEDALNEEIIPPKFGHEWPRERMFTPRGGPELAPEHQARLNLASTKLRESLSQTGLYRLVDSSPAQSVIDEMKSRYLYLHDCNGCDLDIGRALGADQVLVAWVDRVSPAASWSRELVYTRPPRAPACGFLAEK